LVLGGRCRKENFDTFPNVFSVSIVDLPVQKFMRRSYVFGIKIEYEPYYNYRALRNYFMEPGCDTLCPSMELHLTPCGLGLDVKAHGTELW